MRTGAPFILQARLACNGHITREVGIADILELVRCDTTLPLGYEYRVEEIKRSAVLNTVHVMQLLYYSNHLVQLQGVKPVTAFIHLCKNFVRDIDLRAYLAFYEELHIELGQLSERKTIPDPHFSPICHSCAWRAVCVLEMEESRHLSLLPLLAPVGVKTLKDAGTMKWDDVQHLPFDTADELGANNIEWDMVQSALALTEKLCDKLFDRNALLRRTIDLSELPQSRVLLTAVDFDVESVHTKVFGKSASKVSRLNMIDALKSWMCSDE